MTVGGFGGLTIEETATNGPGCCIFTGAGEGPFLNLGRKITHIEPHAYVHVPFVEEMGRAVGMASADEVKALEERIEDLEADNEALSIAWEALSRAKEGSPA